VYTPPVGGVVLVVVGVTVLSGWVLLPPPV
jgi:hypothetical protein